MRALLALLLCVSHAQYFRSGYKQATGATPVLVASCDLSGDGVNDFAVTNYNSNDVSVFVNQKTGSFRSQTIPEANGPYGIVCLDIDGDGRFDLAWGNDGKTGAVDHRLSYVLNRGSGTSGEIIFTPAAHISIGFNPSDMSVADFDKSGTPDIAVAVTDNDQVAILYNVFDKNTSTVKFDQVTVQVGASPYDVSIADFDQNGLPDIALTNNGGNTVSILLNKGDRMWSQQTVQAGVNPLGIWAADFTGDGWPDICVSTGNSIGVLSNNGLLPGGAVGFTNMLFFGAGNAPAEIVVADLNGDGKLDIATPNYYGNSVSILLNNAQGGKVSFAAAVNYATGSRPWGIDSGDFDSDNLTDLVVTNVAENTVSILFGSREVQPTARPSSSSVGSGAVFGIIVAIAMAAIAVAFGTIYALRYCRKRRGTLPEAPERREISLATISSNPNPNSNRFNTFPASSVSAQHSRENTAHNSYPLATVSFAESAPPGAPTYQPPPPASPEAPEAPESPERFSTPSAHDFM